METRTDFKLNDDGDFPLQDTVVSGVWLPTPMIESDDQHKKDIIIYHKGWLKYSPLIGFGISQYRSAESATQSAERNLRIEMKKDGYEIKNGAVKPEKGGGFTIWTKFISRTSH